MAESESILTKGLLANYAREPGSGFESKKVIRAGFPVETGELKFEDGSLYHDEWTANRTGGGQELVKNSEGKTFTRLYAGGTIALEELKSLGLTKKDVTNYLKTKLSELGNKTRLFLPLSPEADAHWQYAYEIKEVLDKIPLTVGRESISYKGRTVFVHYMLLCPVE